MPTNRTRRRRSYAELSADQMAWLRGGEPSPELRYFWTPDECAALWHEFADQMVEEHVREKPGTRPYRWWAYGDSKTCDHRRRRLGGVGTPKNEDAPLFFGHAYGVPADWIWGNEPDIDWYQSRGAALIDVDDPPMFESQAAYLQRLKLLLPGERRRLTKAAFAPESVLDILAIELEEVDESEEDEGDPVQTPALSDPSEEEHGD